MGEELPPQTFSPDIGNDLAGFLGQLEPAVAVSERTSTNLSASTNDGFRLQFNCKRGSHYVGQMRGRGKNRTADKGNYKYLGVGSVLAHKRGGYYAARWIEYQHRHKCAYK